MGNKFGGSISSCVELPISKSTVFVVVVVVVVDDAKQTEHLIYALSSSLSSTQQNHINHTTQYHSLLQLVSLLSFLTILHCHRMPLCLPSTRVTIPTIRTSLSKPIHMVFMIHIVRHWHFVSFYPFPFPIQLMQGVHGTVGRDSQTSSNTVCNEYIPPGLTGPLCHTEPTRGNRMHPMKDGIAGIVCHVKGGTLSHQSTEFQALMDLSQGCFRIYHWLTVGVFEGFAVRTLIRCFFGNQVPGLTESFGGPTT